MIRGAAFLTICLTFQGTRRAGTVVSTKSEYSPLNYPAIRFSTINYL
jgi:hypothetical protein